MIRYNYTLTASIVIPALQNLNPLRIPQTNTAIHKSMFACNAQTSSQQAAPVGASPALVA